MRRFSQSSGNVTSRSPTRSEHEPFCSMLHFKMFLAVFTMLVGVGLAFCINFIGTQKEFTGRALIKPVLQQNQGSQSTPSQGTTTQSTTTRITTTQSTTTRSTPRQSTTTRSTPRQSTTTRSTPRQSTTTRSTTTESTSTEGPSTQCHPKKTLRQGEESLLDDKLQFYLFYLFEEEDIPLRERLCLRHEWRGYDKNLRMVKCERTHETKQFKQDETMEIFHHAKENDQKPMCLHVDPLNMTLTSRICSGANNVFPFTWNPSLLREQNTGLCIRGVHRNGRNPPVEVVDCNANLSDMMWERMSSGKFGNLTAKKRP